MVRPKFLSSVTSNNVLVFTEYVVIFKRYGFHVTLAFMKFSPTKFSFIRIHSMERTQVNLKNMIAEIWFPSCHMQNIKSSIAIR